MKRSQDLLYLCRDWLRVLSAFPEVGTFPASLRAFEDTGGRRTGGKNRQEGKGQDEKGAFRSGF